MTDHVVAQVGDLNDGDRLIVVLEGKEIAVFFVGGEYYAYLNWCAHQGGPVCEGMVTGMQTASFDREHLETTLSWDRDGKILNCPWHGWKYDITDGDCLSREDTSLPSFPVHVDDGQIIVSL